MDVIADGLVVAVDALGASVVGGALVGATAVALEVTDTPVDEGAAELPPKGSLVLLGCSARS